MRTTLIVLAAGAMLAIPLIGKVQQVPGAAPRPPAVADLQRLMEAQTEAIQDLHKRVRDARSACEETRGRKGRRESPMSVLEKEKDHG